MWDDGDAEMSFKDGDGLVKYRQGTTANLGAYRHSSIMGTVDNISGEESGRRALWRICGTKGMDTVVEEIQDGSRRDVGRQRWKNGLEEL